MLNKRLERPLANGLPVSILEIQAGGVGATEPSAFATAMGMLPASAMGTTVAEAAIDGKLPVESIAGATSGPNIVGSLTCQMNAAGTYVITDFDSYTTYDVATVDGLGAVTRAGDTITYTAPNSAGAHGFTVNGKTVGVTVVNPAPLAPSIVSPVNGATGVAAGVTITGSAFSTAIGSDTHVASDWQISTNSGFTNIVSSSTNDTVNKTSWMGSLPTVSTVYYVRVRYKGAAYGYGAWSSTINFTTKASFIISSEEVLLSASDKLANDWFGSSVAMDSTGTRVIVGAYQADINGTNNCGAAYIFTRSGTTWTQEAKLVASDAVNGYMDIFGYTVAIDNTGTRVVIGSYLADPSSVTDTGAAYIFSRSGTTWSEEAILTATDRATNDYFGHSVAMDGTGARAIVGAYNADPNSISNAGAAYIFTRSGTIWTQEAKLLASDKAASDYLGRSVAIDSTGARVIVSAWQADPSGISDAGAAYIFTRSGTTWTQEAKLVASDKVASDKFGSSVAISADASRVVIGSYLADPSSATDAGAAYIFSRSGTTWTQEAKLVANDKAANDYFGFSVAIDSTGSKVVIGGYYFSSKIGAAYIFSRSGTTWTQDNKLSHSQSIVGDYFGISVHIDSSATRVIVGSIQTASGGITNAGAAYIFT